MVGFLEHRYHCFRMDRSDELVGIAGHHRKAVTFRCWLPEARDGEQRLIGHLKPHLALQRLFAVAKVVRLGHPFAELA